MRKPLVVRILSSLDTRAWIAMAVFLGLALAVVPVLHLALPEESPFHVSTYAITLLGKIMCYALVAVAMDLIWGYGSSFQSRKTMKAGSSAASLPIWRIRYIPKA